jgi:urease accessory protein|tara:strand:+ start:1016 stop:1741 length:726 start_codon:yes stop_codon:yes gene_type:complete
LLFSLLFILLLKRYFLEKEDTLDKNFFIIIFILLFSHSSYAHTFTGMIGFYDGLTHPVLGIDHFIAMVSVGIVSAQIGGRAIWTVPLTFVLFMLLGGIIGIAAELNKTEITDAVSLSQLSQVSFLADYIFLIIEFGIVLSVIFLGLAILLKDNFSKKIIMIFVGLFGLCHGGAHGLEMPWASNPILFVLGFILGTSILHLFGVGIGSFAIKTKLSYFLLKFTGMLFAIYGLYLLILHFIFN